MIFSKQSVCSFVMSAHHCVTRFVSHVLRTYPTMRTRWRSRMFAVCAGRSFTDRFSPSAYWRYRARVSFSSIVFTCFAATTPPSRSARSTGLKPALFAVSTSFWSHTICVFVTFSGMPPSSSTRCTLRMPVSTWEISPVIDTSSATAVIATWSQWPLLSSDDSPR